MGVLYPDTLSRRQMMCHSRSLYVTASISNSAVSGAPSLLWRCPDKLVRWVFPLLFSITLVFCAALLSGQHLKNSTNPSDFCGVATALLSVSSQHPVLPEIPTSDSRDPRTRLAFISPTLGFFHWEIISTLSGECLLPCCIEFSWRIVLRSEILGHVSPSTVLARGGHSDAQIVRHLTYYMRLNVAQCITIKHGMNIYYTRNPTRAWFIPRGLSFINGVIYQQKVLPYSFRIDTRQDDQGG